MAETSSGETIGDDVCPKLVWTGDDLEIESIEQADSLPKYTEIDGSLWVRDVAGLKDLSFLECVESINGSLAIFDNPDLESMHGLERLRTLSPTDGSLSTIAVRHNQRLRSFEGLSALTEAEVFSVEDNPMLDSLEGASALEISHWVSVLDNESLRTVGLRALRIVDTIQIGYGACAYQGAEPEPIGNAGLIEFDGLDSLEQYDRVRIGGNPNLESVAGLATALAGSEGGTIWIELNPKLPVADLQAVAEALDGTYSVFKSCSNLDEAEACECGGADGFL